MFGCAAVCVWFNVFVCVCVFVWSSVSLLSRLVGSWVGRLVGWLVGWVFKCVFVNLPMCSFDWLVGCVPVCSGVRVCLIV